MFVGDQFAAMWQNREIAGCPHESRWSLLNGTVKSMYLLVLATYSPVHTGVNVFDTPSRDMMSCVPGFRHFANLAVHEAASLLAYQ